MHQIHLSCHDRPLPSELCGQYRVRRKETIGTTPPNTLDTKDEVLKAPDGTVATWPAGSSTVRLAAHSLCGRSRFTNQKFDVTPWMGQTTKLAPVEPIFTYRSTSDFLEQAYSLLARDDLFGEAFCLRVRTT
jgi:hypothetical protein